jgi:hydroxymethylglutaryl-CoA lyase
MSKKWPSTASIFEVGPRDGLQAESQVLSLDKKLKLIEALVESGLKDIEIGSFVKADWIPQLADSRELAVKLAEKYPSKLKDKRGLRFWGFVPNKRGLEDAVASGMDGVSLFVAASDTFNQKNVNRTQAESLGMIPELLKDCRRNKIGHRVYVSTITFCPYEGRMDPKKVYRLVSELIELGVREVVLSDTTGDANPRSLSAVLAPIVKKNPPKKFSLHLHDTRGLALANCLVGLDYGITRFDASIAGLGGCPFAPGATGNLSTENLANMLLGMGLLKGVDLGALVQAGLVAEALLVRQLPSHVLQAMKSKVKS